MAPSADGLVNITRAPTCQPPAITRATVYMCPWHATLHSGLARRRGCQAHKSPDPARPTITPPAMQPHCPPPCKPHWMACSSCMRLLSQHAGSLLSRWCRPRHLPQSCYRPSPPQHQASGHVSTTAQRTMQSLLASWVQFGKDQSADLAAWGHRRCGGDRALSHSPTPCCACHAGPM